MFHEKLKSYFSDAVSLAASEISRYAVNPGKDFTRIKKLRADKLLTLLVSCGASATKPELLDFFGMSLDSPSASAFSQQRAKLKPQP